MSSCVGKIMERLINDRLMWLAEKKGWLDPHQNGFRKGRSCVDSLVRFVTDVELSRQADRNTIAIFLDVSSAYDNVRTNVLVDTLLKKGCPSRIVRYIDAWMRNRDTRFIVGDEEVLRRVVNKGLSQGGVLSPSLYNIYTSEISSGATRFATVLQYAEQVVRL